MALYEEERIHSILGNILGKSKNDGYSNGWRSYNCPYCANEGNGVPDGKYNLETNVSHGGSFHCWKCEEHGRISRLIRDFGSQLDLNEYKYWVYELRKRLPDSKYIDSTDIASIDLEPFITLPDGFRKFDKRDKRCFDALRYLYGRNVNDDIIKKFNIGYIDGSEMNEYGLRNRIIIPSYDFNGDLNYWVGRDYTMRSKIRYRNPKIPKSNIVFNGKFINWYEDVTLVEGPFDHIVTPNSIPLLGKAIKKGSVLYNMIFNNARANINVFLDPDAALSALRMYKVLDHGELKGRVRMIRLTGDYDASLVNQKFGRIGIIHALRKARKIDELSLQCEIV